MPSFSVFGILAQDVMTEDPVWVEATSTLGEVARVLNDKAVRHVPVLDDGVVVGIVSDRDVRSAVPPIYELANNLQELTSCLDTKVNAVMTTPVNTVEPTRDLRDVIDIMLEFHLGAVLVVDSVNSKLVGIISYVDVLRALKDL